MADALRSALLWLALVVAACALFGVRVKLSWRGKRRRRARASDEGAGRCE